jgi:hypothetical protein
MNNIKRNVRKMSGTDWWIPVLLTVPMFELLILKKDELNQLSVLSQIIFAFLVIYTVATIYIFLDKLNKFKVTRKPFEVEEDKELFLSKEFKK